MLIIEVSDGDAPDWVLQSVEGEKAHAMDALNRKAKTAVDEIKADMPAKFTLRSRWAQKGIRSDKANQDDLTARVYSVDPWLLKQEEGETYRPSGHVAIPKGARTSERSLIPRAMFPNALRGRKDVFLGDFSTNTAWKLFPHKGIFQRLQNGKRLRLLYLLKNQKTTKARWGFGPQVEDAVDRYFERFYDDISTNN